MYNNNNNNNNKKGPPPAPFPSSIHRSQSETISPRSRMKEYGENSNSSFSSFGSNKNLDILKSPHRDRHTSIGLPVRKNNQNKKILKAKSAGHLTSKITNKYDD
jgi:hypothetical protein